MNAFDVLGDPVRRRILECLQTSELKSGSVVEVIHQEFGITQAAVSQHLKVLRDAGFISPRVEGAKRIYRLEPGRFAEVDAWLGGFRKFWVSKLDALEEELRASRVESADEERPKKAVNERRSI